MEFGVVSAFVLFIIGWLIPFLLQRFLPVVGLLPLNITLVYVYLSMPILVVMNSWASVPVLAFAANSSAWSQSGREILVVVPTKRYGHWRVASRATCCCLHHACFFPARITTASRC